MSANIGRNIKLFREKSGISQEEIADYVGIKRDEKREVSLLHLGKIADYLNIDLESFLEEDPTEIKPDLALAFRANELTPSDRDQIVFFKRVVKNFLKMKNLETNGL